MAVSTLSGDVAPKPMDADGVRQHNAQAHHGELHQEANNERTVPRDTYCSVSKTHSSTVDGSTLFRADSGEHKEALTVHTKNSGCIAPGDSPISSASPIGYLKHQALRYAPTKLVFTTITGEQPECPTAPRPPRPWRATALRLGPLSGLFIMMVAIASIMVSLGILVGSDGAPIADWSAPPSTYLAICTAVANLCIRYACVQGVVIAWWYRAFKGSTLAKLHYDWRSGTTLRGALTAGRHTGLLALACIFSTLVVIDGPLLQRSSTVVTSTISDHPVTLNVTMAPEIPRGYTGIWATKQDLHTGHYFNSPFNATMPAGNRSVSNAIYVQPQLPQGLDIAKMFFSDAPLQDVMRGCPGDLCKAKLVAPALVPTVCSDHELPVDYNQPGGVPPGESEMKAPALDRQALLASFSLVLDASEETLAMVTGYSTTQHCKGTFKYTACTLRAAVAEYDVSINRGRVVLDSPAHPTILALANNTGIFNDTITDFSKEAHHSTLAAIVTLAYYKWSNYAYFYTKEKGYPIQTSSSGPQNLVYADPDLNGPISPCTSYRDLKPDVSADLNRMMVYSGLVAAREDASYLESRMDPGLKANTTVTGSLVGQQSIYRAQYHYFAGALLVEVICIALIIPTYYGFWLLGRPVSFSPLEMAKAFESPMLDDCYSNSSGRDIAKSAAGETHIRYGAARGGGQTRLAFDSTGSVYSPMIGLPFDV